MIALACALLSATAFGLSDFVGGVASRRIAALAVMLIAYPVAIPAFVALATLTSGEIDVSASVFGSLAGFAQGIGVWWLFLALARSQMSVVAPLTALLAAGIPVLTGILFGERPGEWPLLGILVALVSVALISHTRDPQGTRVYFGARTLWLTLGAGSMSGLVLVLLHHVSDTSGVWSLVFARTAASLIVALLAAAAHTVRPATGPLLRFAVAISVADVVANAAMLFALRQSMLSLASVMISLYPAVTVALAVAIQGERITRSQQVGMVLGATAIAAIASGS